MPELELTEPPDDWSPEVELLLELVEEDDDVEPDVDDVEVVLVAPVPAAAVPGTVAALTAANTPVAANATMATPAVSWLMNRWAPSRAEILDWTDCVVCTVRSSPGLLKRIWELAENRLRETAQPTMSLLGALPECRARA